MTKQASKTVSPHLCVPLCGGTPAAQSAQHNHVQTLKAPSGALPQNVTANLGLLYQIDAGPAPGGIHFQGEHYSHVHTATSSSDPISHLALNSWNRPC